MDELSKREQRAIMLEQQRPAYARSDEARRAIDDLYRQARTLTKVTGMHHSVRAIVPHQHKYVSGLNVLSNFEITVQGVEGTKLFMGSRPFERLQRRAKKALCARNED